MREFNDNKITELAERTLKVAKHIMTLPDEEPEEETLQGEPSDSPFVGDWVIDKSFARWELHVRPDLTGTYEDGSGYSCKLGNVKVEDDNVAFSFVIDKGGFGIDIQFEGKVNGDRLDGVGMGNGFEMPIDGERA